MTGPGDPESDAAGTFTPVGLRGFRELCGDRPSAYIAAPAGPVPPQSVVSVAQFG